MIDLIPINDDLETDIDYGKIANKSFINVDEEIERQPIALSIGDHEYRGSLYPTPVASYGDFFCLVGASKSRKTYAKKAILAAYIGGRSNEYFKDIKGHLNKDKIVIDNDTEQSNYHTQRGARQVLDMVGSKYPHYYPYSLRSCTPTERIGVIKWQLENIKNIGLMFIDGIADLVKNVNDLDECNEVTQLLMSWSKDYNICIGTILHMNYGSMKATGHLGSAVTKKAESVIAVSTTDGVTKLEAQFTRNIPFKDIEFEINNNGLPQQTAQNELPY